MTRQGFPWIRIRFIPVGFITITDLYTSEIYLTWRVPTTQMLNRKKKRKPIQALFAYKMSTAMVFNLAFQPKRKIYNFMIKSQTLQFIQRLQTDNSLTQSNSLFCIPKKASFLQVAVLSLCWAFVGPRFSMSHFGPLWAYFLEVALFSQYWAVEGFSMSPWQFSVKLFSNLDDFH